MKVSIEGILGSAQKMNRQRKVEGEQTENRNQASRGDSVNLTRKVNTRLDGIDSEVRDIQTSLTRNQIIRNGIGALQQDYARGGTNQRQIMNDYTYQGEQVLRNHVGDNITGELLDARRQAVDQNIMQEVSSLRRLQVEADNLMASNLAGPEQVDRFMENNGDFMTSLRNANPENLSNLSYDSVMRLTR
jgi:hypothetical protein